MSNMKKNTAKPKSLFCLLYLLIPILFSCRHTAESIAGALVLPPAEDVHRRTAFLSEVVVRVGPGETIDDFIGELDSRHLATRAALLYIAAHAAFEKYPIVPPPLNEIRRFEGLFAPGEYVFTGDQLPDLRRGADSHERAVRNAECIVRRLLEESAPIFRLDPETKGLKLYEYMILASIIEKEAITRKDYDKISSVFHNRLKVGIAFRSCVTVEYALGYHRPFLLYSDLAINSPYNTYVHKSLPPTPICFFSKEAFQAAVSPPHTDFYFFVFDETQGDLHFSRTYDEHKKKADQAAQNYIKMNGSGAIRKKTYARRYEE
jgi:cell division protein YceG involved in septum cleavage